MDAYEIDLLPLDMALTGFQHAARHGDKSAVLKVLEAENEIIEICSEALTLLQQHLLPFTNKDNARILYLTMWVTVSTPCCLDKIYLQQL